MRSTRGKIVHKIQDMAARMHFNHTTLEQSKHIELMSNGSTDKVKIRYGVIQIDDMLRDL